MRFHGIALKRHSSIKQQSKTRSSKKDVRRSRSPGRTTQCNMRLQMALSWNCFETTLRHQATKQNQELEERCPPVSKPRQDNSMQHAAANGAFMELLRNDTQ